MPIISRLFTYNPGESARGDHVQQEFDQLVSTVNTLENAKLSTDGGTVANLTVSGTFTAQGTSVFNAGLAVNNQIGTFTAGINSSAGLITEDALIVGDGIVSIAGTGLFEIDRDVDFKNHALSGISTLDSFGATNGVAFGGAIPPNYAGGVETITDNDHLTNKEYIDNNAIAKISSSALYEVLDGVTIGVGAKSGGSLSNGIQVHNTVGEPVAAAERGLLSNNSSYSTISSLGLEQFLLFTGRLDLPFQSNNDLSVLGINHFSMRGANNQDDKFVMTRDELRYSDGSSGNESNLTSRQLQLEGPGSVSHIFSVALGLSLINGGQSTSFTVDPGAVLEMNAIGLPTSAGGLSTGDIWNNSGVLTIV